MSFNMAAIGVYLSRNVNCKCVHAMNELISKRKQWGKEWKTDFSGC